MLDQEYRFYVLHDHDIQSRPCCRTRQGMQLDPLAQKTPSLQDHHEFHSQCRFVEGTASCIVRPVHA